MRSIKEKFIEVLEKECKKVGILLYAWDTVNWNNIKDYLEEYLEKDEVYDSKMPLAAFMANVFNELLKDLGSRTEIDTYHESVGYICERCIVYYLISEYHIPDVDWILGWVDFFIRDGHFEEVSFVPFEYLIKPYFDDTEDIRKGRYDLFYILKDRWEKAGYLYITERRVNEFLETL